MRLKYGWTTAAAAAIFPSIAAAQSIRGTIVDSMSGKGIVGARIAVSGTSLQVASDSLGRFALSRVPKGEFGLAVRTASLDSIGAVYSIPVTVEAAETVVALRVPAALQIAASACGPAGYGTRGILLGRLRVDADSQASLSGTVSAEWSGPKSAGPPNGALRPSLWASASADARGRFALCGVPLDTEITLTGLASRASGQMRGVKVPRSARFARTELVLHKEVTTTGILAGVVTDSLNHPITAAEVSLPELSKSAFTNEQGAFAIRDVSPGAHHVVVRHVGFAAIDAHVTIDAGRSADRSFRMVRATTLDSVVVTEAATDHMLDDFEANKHLGLGHFLTRADLAPQEGRSTAAVLTSIPGIKVYARGPYGWVGSGRHNIVSLSNAAGVGLDAADILRHAPLWDCYSLVYLDDHLVFRGQKFPTAGGLESARPYRWEPLFDVNSIPVAQIEAIEYYASAAQTPAKYSMLNSECGVLVIHTLRYHPRDTTSAAPKPRSP